MLTYDTERLKAVLREEPRKEKDMFTIISKFYLNSELKHEARMHTSRAMMLCAWTR